MELADSTNQIISCVAPEDVLRITSASSGLCATSNHAELFVSLVDLSVGQDGFSLMRAAQLLEEFVACFLS